MPHFVKPRLGAVAIAAIWAALAAWPLQAEIDWQPSRTWVFAVGLLQWQNSSLYASFPAAMPHRSDRRLVELFKAAGLPADRIIFLEDSQATKQRIQGEFIAQLSRSKPGDLLIFYFAGHGSRNMETHETYFANYDAGERWNSLWPTTSIVDAIERHFRGEQAILMADCCHSGALYDEVKRRESKLSYACLTSAYSHNSSTGNWTFTDAMLKGWGGDPLVDADADGEISMTEMANYAALDMACFEQQKSMFVATGDFDPDLRLADARSRHAPGAGRRVEIEWKGKWWPGQVLALNGKLSKVHYAGFNSDWDEWVAPERLRSFRFHSLPRGAHVEVLWSGDKKWYAGTVVASQHGLHKIHYDGYSHEWDEWVGGKAVRLVKPGEQR